MRRSNISAQKGRALPQFFEHLRNSGRRHFLLMEVLIAIALLSVSLSLIIRPHAQIMRYQSTLIEELARTRAADLAMGEVRQLLYENQIPWKSLRHGEKRPTHHDQLLTPVDAGGYRFIAGCHVEIDEKRTKQWTKGGQPTRDWRLLKVFIMLTPEKGGMSTLHDYALVTQRNTKHIAK